ncbi:putative Alanine or Glycine Cation Symporter (AGCS) family protein [Candidatus Protochlamydia naegleriophila]|uniref:Putative Alanine or Glycine Cation Symporter (AGCS) family protein n=1 Tax=Candidatus Protochlamydia naegleriophila TaxID=389348 RepID=A0A0U5JBG3_9BACT|nr:amino acid carrier protein [Candidatus Protochlamydia naegleriophila]CUI17192.1 putative Alanine or Glycine Cation Symporter (AGCS) family protein [Candidatus Protochlamydia naegleriophila]
MLTELSSRLDLLEDILWTYCGVPIVMLLGLYLSIKSGFFQIRHLPTVFKTFLGFLRVRDSGQEKGGVHPLKAFFAAVGGCVGIGNIVGICTAVQLGGPGALFWIWMTAIAGMILKYSEVYLGLRYRVPNGSGGYNGGPMYFLQKAFNNTWVPKLVCILLCVYGVEVYQFSVISTSITGNLGINSYLVIGVLLALVIFAGSGGVRRVGSISSTSLPIFVVLYVGMGMWVLLNNLPALPGVVSQVFTSAFSGHAAVGGFVGAGVMSTMSYGIRRGCYTGDIGVGYASVIHSESSVQIPEKQASLAIFDIFLDTFIVCTTSLFLILTTGIWQEPIEAGMLVQLSLGEYFPYMHFFMPLFLFMLGYNTINAYFCVGLKCAEHLSPKYGRAVYYAYAVLALLIFSFMGTSQAQTVMAIAGVSLLIINGCGIFMLRHEISFDLASESRAREQEPLLSKVSLEQV